MKRSTKRVNRNAERGVALVIALFTLMLISAVATALILMAGTASAIKSNYKMSMQAFYDAKAGLEEGRSRLWSSSPNALGACVGNPMAVGQVCYITNPDAAAGETSVDPKSTSDVYCDTEYDNEFGQGSLAAANVTEVASTSPLASPNIAGPLYKWVRITPRTEKSAGVNLDGVTRPGTGTSPLYYDGTQLTTASGNSQVLTVTALAVTPGAGLSGRRLLQYTVAQNPDPNKLGQMLGNGSAEPAQSLIFQAALTLDGNDNSGVAFNAPNLVVNGNDGATPPAPGVQGVAYTNNTDPAPTCTCQSPTGTPGAGPVTLPPQMTTPNGLDALVQDITLVANTVITGPADDGSLPSTMSASNPMIVVVNGDFHLSHGHGSSGFSGIGYGLLLVTGTLDYDPDDSWNGIILVIGKGVFTNNGENGKNGQINGAILVAKTRDSSGNLLTNLGAASFTQTSGAGVIRYNSSAINQAQGLLSLPYQVLSFREIALTQ